MKYQKLSVYINHSGSHFKVKPKDLYSLKVWHLEATIHI